MKRKELENMFSRLIGASFDLDGVPFKIKYVKPTNLRLSAELDLVELKKRQEEKEDAI